MPTIEPAPLFEVELPYPGLRPFEADEAFLFYGRKSHTEELLKRLATNRFLAVVGTSGSGKSSLVRAGLLPALYRGFLAGGTSQWRIAVMKPGDAPMANLAKALGHQKVPADELGRSSLGLVRAVNQSSFAPGEGLLIVVDQFEELFRFRHEQTDGGAEATLFVTSLLEAADSFSAPIYVVLTMRSEFLGDCAQFRGLAEAMNRSQYLIPRLTREQLREAIEKPVRLVNTEMTPRLVQRLLNELREDPDQLPVLQHALNRTFRKWKALSTTDDIDFAQYEAAKTIEGALDDHAAALVSELPEAARPWVEKLFRCLTTTLPNGRTVRRASRIDQIHDVLGITDQGSRALVRIVIEKFAHKDNSLVVCAPPGELQPESVIDISHESLIARWSQLTRWVEEEAEAVRWYRSAAEDALRHRRGETGTWRDPELKRALALAERGPWNKAWTQRNLPDCGIEYEDVRVFLKRGAAEQRAEKLRARAWWIATTALLLIALVSLGALWLERGRMIKSQQAKIKSDAEKIASDAKLRAAQEKVDYLHQLLKNPDLSPSQKEELWKKFDTASAELTRTQADIKALGGQIQAGDLVPERTVVQPIAPPPPYELATDSRSALTQHNNSMRTGAWLFETQLTPATVANGMQLRYSRPVNGALTAQLLYVHRVRINSKARNIIYAFTEENSVYAYDADEERESGTNRGLIWSRSLPDTASPIFRRGASGKQTVGILSTPVIDKSSGTLYLVYSISNGLFPSNGVGDGSPLYQVEFHLAALDMRSGTVLQDRVVTGSVPSSVPPSHVDFVPQRQTQQAGLLLLRNPLKNGESTIYVAFGGRWREETHNYHGWLMGYDTKTFAPRGVFCSTPDWRDKGEGGGISQGGGGLGGDENGSVYFNTGSGPASGNDHGNSIVKLTPVLRAGKYDFNVQALSTEADDPAHASQWRNNEIGLDSGGPTLIPDSSRLVSGGKTGVLYLVDRSTMKKVQSFEAFSVNPANDPDPEGARFRDWGHGPHLDGPWTSWTVSPTRGYIYHWAQKDFLRRFDYDRTTGQINPANVVAGDVLAKPYPVTPGGLISLSANGTKNGVLWATLPWNDGTGRIMAFDAITLRRLWDTSLDKAATSHNAPPTVADGKVIVGTMNGNFLVYALASPSPAPSVQDPVPRILEFLVRLPPDRAAVIAPPKGNRPLFLAIGAAPGPSGEVSPYCYKGPDKGSLTYQVKQVESAASPQWVLVEVSGDLCDDSGIMPQMANRGLGMVLASAQPGLTWKETNGGLVHWSLEASVNAPQGPVEGEIRDAPWMLFRSAPSAGHDLLDQVTYVQLVGTVGGAPPANVGQIGKQVKVPYIGTYVFYVRSSGTQGAPAP